MQNEKQVAKKFWEESTIYPAYPHIQERRAYEVAYLLPYLRETKTLKDVGCGDGSLVQLLQELTNIRHFGVYDQSDALLQYIESSERVYKFRLDCSEAFTEPLPYSDVTVLGGLIQYLFDDREVGELLKNLNSPTVFVRTACNVQRPSEIINTKSDTLGKEYSSYYRTIADTAILLESGNYVIEDVRRIYPDEIESKFGTKQFYFKLKKHE
jgi:SAM-dependent methyltransferase